MPFFIIAPASSRNPLAGKDVARAASVLKWLQSSYSPYPHVRKVLFVKVIRRLYKIVDTIPTPQNCLINARRAVT